ncbi:MAG: DUF559 domain-containing protein [Actinobacteria bacterium]|nr:DUF559 domain-containing protein [Actinomycetota bacterium]
MWPPAQTADGDERNINHHMGGSSHTRRPEEAVRRRMQAQFGCIHRDEALALGLSRRQIDRLLLEGRWRRVRPSVYRIAGIPPTWEQKVFSALAWAGRSAVASHLTAARRWRFEGFSTKAIHLSTNGAWRRPPDGVIVHRVGHCVLSHAANVGGIRVTSMPRTVFDLIAGGNEHGDSVLDQAIRRRGTFFGQMWLLLDEPWTHRHRGIATVRRAMEQRTPMRASTQIDLADPLRRLMRSSRLPAPVPEFAVELPSGLIHIDLAYPLLKLAIECDGYGSHMDPTSFERDRARDAELMALGWRVLRFTWAQITYRPDWVLEQVRGRLTT